MIKVKIAKIIDEADFSALVREVYGRDYCYQQQDGCKDRGYYPMSVPEDSFDDNMPDDIAGDEDQMGVKFKTWLEKDPKTPGYKDDWKRRFWWERHFYPDFGTVVNDLYSKGKLEKGEYLLRTDW